MTTDDPNLGDAIEALRGQFLSEVDALRPRLHRYCTRMTGSVLDGEDLVQDALVHAFYRLPSLKEESAMAAWLFRIAHNKCIDFLRAKKPNAVPSLVHEASYEAVDRAEERQELGRALEAVVGGLPPKERASVLLKDAFDYSLIEIAEIIDSTPGGVKAALHRGRSKLHKLSTNDPGPDPVASEEPLLHAYLQGFNAQDWDTVRGLIQKDARLELVGMGDSALNKNYFGNYSRLPWTWHLGFARVDGERMIVHYKLTDGTWRPHAALSLRIKDGAVSVIRDYVHVDYLMEHAHVQPIGALPPTDLS